jgi:hypothetical protein
VAGQFHDEPVIEVPGLAGGKPHDVSLPVFTVERIAARSTTAETRGRVRCW